VVAVRTPEAPFVVGGLAGDYLLHGVHTTITLNAHVVPMMMLYTQTHAAAAVTSADIVG